MKLRGKQTEARLRSRRSRLSRFLPFARARTVHQGQARPTNPTKGARVTWTHSQACAGGPPLARVVTLSQALAKPEFESALAAARIQAEVDKLLGVESESEVGEEGEQE